MPILFNSTSIMNDFLVFIVIFACIMHVIFLFSKFKIPKSIYCFLCVLLPVESVEPMPGGPLPGFAKVF